MLNTVYRLTAPRTIEPVVVSQDTTDKVIVRPTHLSICNADQRYYQGTRSKEVLAKKLPMALIHDFTADSVVAPCCTPSFTGRPSAAAAASNEAFTSALLSDALS